MIHEGHEVTREDARILISTDAGGEGLNLQFCHVVIDHDIPWNPIRLEQRIGRSGRSGLAHAVRTVNFVFEGSVGHRVREVLEQKAAVIFEEFGIDKTVEAIRLPQVRNYRLNLLGQEERNFQEQLDQKAHAYPGIMPPLVIRVEGGGHD